MYIEDYIQEALETVSTWNIPDEDFVHAVSDQANLLAMVNSDELGETILN